MSDLTPRPWNALPTHVAEALRPELPTLADEIVEAIRHGVPGYARPLEGPFGRGLRTGVEVALTQFLEMIERPDADRGAGRDVYLGLGKGELRAGRTLDALLAAYRLGARVAWRRLALAGERAGLEPRVLYGLAESIFAYIDELSGESIEGYASEQAVAAGERQRLRRRLAGLLIQDPPADALAVEEAAVAVGWELPARLAVLVTDGGDGERLATQVGPDSLGLSLPSGACAIVPDPSAPGRLAQLEAACGARWSALGPPVSWEQAAVSMHRALATLVLARERSIDASPETLVLAAAHELELLLHADARLTHDLASRVLAPLGDETPASRARLTETLRQWLRHRGRTDQVAGALHVHPQTVRYRLARLRELFGEALDDPDGRLRLELSLRFREGSRVA